MRKLLFSFTNAIFNSVYCLSLLLLLIDIPIFIVLLICFYDYSKRALISCIK